MHRSHAAAIAAGIALATTGVPGAAQTAPSASVALPAFACSSVYVGRVERLDDAGTRYAIGLATRLTARTASGTLALYQGDTRYDVRFENAAIASRRTAGSTATPIVVRFAQPVALDAAVVTELGDPAPRRCDPLFSPWVPQAPETRQIGRIMARLSPPRPGPAPAPQLEDPTLWSSFRSAASIAPAVEPQHQETEAHPSCARPATVATTTHAVEPEYPDEAIARRVTGTAQVLVTLDENSRIVDATIGRSSGFKPLDDSARAAAQGAEFRTATFRCRPVAGTFWFVIEFRD